MRNAALLTAGVGALHGVLFLTSYWLLSSRPGPTASIAEITAFYRSSGQRRVMIVGLYLMPFAGIAFIWFVVALRMWVAATALRVNILLSNIQLVAGILYIALLFAGAASTSVLAASVEFSKGDVDPVAAYQFPQFGSTLILVFALRMAAMFVVTTSTIGRTSHVLPPWFAWSGYLVGIFLLLERVPPTLARAGVSDLADRVECDPAAPCTQHPGRSHDARPNGPALSLTPASDYGLFGRRDRKHGVG